MKYLRVVLVWCAVFLLMTAGLAFAEEKQPTEVIDGFTVQSTNQSDCMILQVDESTIQNGTLIIPPSLGDYNVVSIASSALSENVKLMLMPWNCFIMNDEENPPDQKVEFRMVQYKDFKALSSDELDQLPEIGKDEYVLTLFQRVAIAVNGNINYYSRSSDDYLTPEEIPDTLFGVRTHNLIDPSALLQKSGDWVYVKNKWGDDIRAQLKEYNGVAGEIFVVPETLEDCRVSTVEVSAIPEGTAVIYLPDSASINSKDEAFSAEMMLFSYLSYDQATKDSSYYLEGNPDFTEGTYLLTGISTCRITGTSVHNDSYRDVYPIEKVLTEIDGRPLINSQVRDALAITSGEYTYTLNSRDGAIVCQAPETDRKGLMLVPGTVDGYKVEGVRASAVQEETNELLVRLGVYLQDQNELTHDVRVYSYIDYEYIQQQGYEYEPYSAVLPDEYVLESYPYLYKQDGSNEHLTQDYYEYPTTVNGHRIVLNFSKEDVTTYTKDHFAYYKLTPETVCICGYDDGEVRKLDVPSTLDGLTVVALSGLSYNSVIEANNLTELTLPSTLKVLGNRAIYTSKLKALTLPEGLEELGSNAITAYRLKKLKLPDSLKSIGYRALNIGAGDLQIPEGVERIAPEAFVYCNSLKSLKLPAGMKEIPKGMCQGLTRLGSISIPEGVTSIGDNAFNGCSRLKNVKFLGTSLTRIGESAFVDCAALSNLKLPEGLEEVGRQAFYGCKKVNNLVFPDSMKTIGEVTFGECRALSRVTVGAGVSQIDDTAFNDCAKKLTFTAPEGCYAYQWAQGKGYAVKPAK